MPQNDGKQIIPALWEKVVNGNKLLKTIISLYIFPDIWEPLTTAISGDPKDHEAHLEIMRFACLASDVIGDPFRQKGEKPDGTWWPYDAKDVIENFSKSKTHSGEAVSTNVIDFIKRLQRLAVVADESPICIIPLLEVCSGQTRGSVGSNTAIA